MTTIVCLTCAFICYVEAKWFRAMQIRLDVLADAHAQIRFQAIEFEKAIDELHAMLESKHGA